jgi:hypothetical protein
MYCAKPFASRGSDQPIELLVKTFDPYRTAQVTYFEGLRYPYLERIDGTEDRLTTILKASYLKLREHLNTASLTAIWSWHGSLEQSSNT